MIPSAISGVLPDALVLAVEADCNESFPDRPTFVEYPSGKGRAWPP